MTSLIECNISPSQYLYHISLRHTDIIRKINYYKIISNIHIYGFLLSHVFLDAISSLNMM